MRDSHVPVMSRQMRTSLDGRIVVIFLNTLKTNQSNRIKKVVALY